MKRLIIILTIFISILCAQDKTTMKIAFGSCADQVKKQPIWEAIVAEKPDLFIFAGDNVYADTMSMYELKRAYWRLAQKKGYQKLLATCPVIATWDDHDYGMNDVGAEYLMKYESQKIFLDFFRVPAHSARRKRNGIYAAYYYGPEENRIQIILLDTRFFRGKRKRIIHTKEMKEQNIGPYVPNHDVSVTMLGKEQWKWLEKELAIQARTRIIVSSTQFLTEGNGWEAWSNLPHERKRMLSLIKKTKAEGVIFISGDTHWAELSRIKQEGMYPIYDMTSSGLTEVWKGLGPNKNRIGKAYLDANFGLIKIVWKPEPQIIMEICDVNGKVQIKKILDLNELKFSSKSKR